MKQWTVGSKINIKNRLGPRAIKCINNDLVALKSVVPSDFVRHARSLSDVPRWKATEFRQFLLYTGPVVLKSHLEGDLYNNFTTLHVALNILLSPKFWEIEQTYASRLFSDFVTSFAKLYGRENVSQNVHSLSTLGAEDVSVFGPLDN